MQGNTDKPGSSSVGTISEASSETAKTESDASSKTETVSSEGSLNPESSSKPSVSSKPQTTSKPAATSKPAVSPKPTSSAASTSSAPKPKTAKELVIGRWQAVADFSPALKDSGIEITGPVNIKCTMEFTTSGTLIESVDQEAYNALLKRALNQSFEKEFAANQITKEQFEAQIGMTLDEYIDTYIQMMDLKVNVVSSYKFEGDKLFIKAQGETEFEEAEYRFNGEDSLTTIEDDMVVTYTRIK